ncbi:MAG: hypothetical protein QM655_12925 [Nocardioidaceae bacterium]
MNNMALLWTAPAAVVVVLGLIGVGVIVLGVLDDRRPRDHEAVAGQPDLRFTVMRGGPRFDVLPGARSALAEVMLERRDARGRWYSLHANGTGRLVFGPSFDEGVAKTKQELLAEHEHLQAQIETGEMDQRAAQVETDHIRGQQNRYFNDGGRRGRERRK